MRLVSRFSVLLVIGVCITTTLPIMAAITVARQQAVESQQMYAIDLAKQALARSDSTADQLAHAAQAINGLDPEEACAASGLKLMREIDLGSTMLQGVGWVQGDTMLCSSFRGNEPVELGPSDFVSDSSSRVWISLTSLDPDRPYLAVQSGAFIGIVHKDLALSFVDEIPGLSLAVFSRSRRLPLISRGEVPLEHLQRDLSRQGVFRVDGKTVAVVRSERYDTGAVAILSGDHVAQYTREATLLLVPLGVVVSLILSIVLMHIVKSRSSMPAMIDSALRKGKFHLAYQPVVDLRSGEIIGAEALVRWDRGRDPSIPPERFVRVAEEAGLITRITSHVLDLLAEDAKHVLPLEPNFRFAVNFSAADMQRATIVDEVGGLLKRSGLPWTSLVVEATEHSLIDVKSSNENMRRLRGEGVTVAIDDFGTGYSSLACLAELQVDFLKIDKMFVQSLGTGSVTSQVAARIIQMAKDLDLKIVAEGVETRRQQMILANLGVDYAQGYLFSKPMSLNELLQRLRKQRAGRRQPAATAA